MPITANGLAGVFRRALPREQRRPRSNFFDPGLRNSWGFGKAAPTIFLVQSRVVEARRHFDRGDPPAIRQDLRRGPAFRNNGRARNPQLPWRSTGPMAG